MTVTVNDFLPFGLKNMPAAIFACVSENLRKRELLDAFLDAVKGRGRITDVTRAQLAARPELVANIFEQIAAEDMPSFIPTPAHALHVVAARPTLLPYLHDRIIGDPETAEQLYFLSKGFDRLTQSKASADFPLIDPAEVLVSMQERPMHTMRVLANTNRAEFLSFNEQIGVEAQGKKLASPWWALTWLTRNHVLMDEPLDAEFANVIKQSEGASYLAMRLLRDAVADPVVWESLESAITSPRWAYHCLRQGLILKEHQRIFDILLASPDWLVEYLTDTKASYSTIQKVYVPASATSAHHPLIGELHNWFAGVGVVQAVGRGSRLSSSP